MYFQRMSRVSTYGDEITLRAISSVHVCMDLNFYFYLIVSTLGQYVMVDITSDPFSKGLITISHLDEKMEFIMLF